MSLLISGDLEKLQLYGGNFHGYSTSAATIILEMMRRGLSISLQGYPQFLSLNPADSETLASVEEGPCQRVARAGFKRASMLNSSSFAKPRRQIVSVHRRVPATIPAFRRHGTKVKNSNLLVMMGLRTVPFG